jgi:hypothetical protein
VATASLAACGPESAGQAPGGFSLVASADSVPRSWTVGTWFVDPLNASGNAKDTNDCQTAHSPCVSFSEIANRWGTHSPRLRQTTSLTFLSSQQNGNDPVTLTPQIENGAVVSLQGALGPAQLVATSTLSNVTSKNRGAGQLLAATLPAQAQPGMLVVNTTHASRAWVYGPAGTQWFLSQPFLPETIPPSWNPQEIDTWASGDRIEVYQPVSVDLVEASPTLVDCDSGNACTNDLLVYQLAVLDPNGIGADALTLSGPSLHVSLVESSVQRSIVMSGGAADWYPNFTNVDAWGPIRLGIPAGYAYFFGGDIRGTAAGTQLVGGLLADDAIAGTSLSLGDGMFGSLYLAPGVTLTAIDGVDWWWTSSGQVDGSTVLWGPGAVDVAGGARFEYPSGSGGATATFRQGGGLTVDEQATACSVDTQGTGAWTCGIALTPANLDATVASGGFGGSAVERDGGSLSNVRY